jgi:hypothetical protein
MRERQLQILKGLVEGCSATFPMQENAILDGWILGANSIFQPINKKNHACGLNEHSVGEQSSPYY